MTRGVNPSFCLTLKNNYAIYNCKKYTKGYFIDIMYNNIKKLLITNEKDINSHHIKAFTSIIEETGIEVFYKYGYKLTTFWDFFFLSEEEISHIHPNVFTYYRRRLHLLPLKVYCCLTPEQIYGLFHYYQIFDNISFFVIKTWMKKYSQCNYSSDYFDERGIPPLRDSFRRLNFTELLEALYKHSIKKAKRQSLLKNESFYIDNDMISLVDLNKLLVKINTVPILDTGPSNSKKYIEKKLLDIDGIKETLIDNEYMLCSYSKVLQMLNKRYAYSEIKTLFHWFSLVEFSQKYFRETEWNSLNELKQTYTLIDSYHLKYLPSLKLTPKRIIYFYEDVVKYIEGQRNQ